MEMSEELEFNIVKDWEKKNISIEEKSEFVKYLLKKYKISQRELSDKINVPQSTISGWITGHDSLKSVHDTRLKRQEVIYLTSRLLFILTKIDDLSPKAKELLSSLKSELEMRLK